MPPPENGQLRGAISAEVPGLARPCDSSVWRVSNLPRNTLMRAGQSVFVTWAPRTVYFSSALRGYLYTNSLGRPRDLAYRRVIFLPV
jgi:hypothetical protein